MRTKWTSDANVYSVIGRIDQPTYLTHCSLNREIRGNVLQKTEEESSNTGNLMLVIKKKEATAHPLLPQKIFTDL